MALNADQESYLNDILELFAADPTVCTSWECGFLNDQRERYDEEGPNMYLSPKQFGIVRRIGEQRYGVEFDSR